MEEYERLFSWRVVGAMLYTQGKATERGGYVLTSFFLCPRIVCMFTASQHLSTLAVGATRFGDKKYTFDYDSHSLGTTGCPIAFFFRKSSLRRDAVSRI